MYKRQGEAGFNGSDNMHIIEMPHVEETIAPIFYTVPLQLLAYHAIKRRLGREGFHAALHLSLIHI